MKENGNDPTPAAPERLSIPHAGTAEERAICDRENRPDSAGSLRWKPVGSPWKKLRGPVHAVAAPAFPVTRAMSATLPSSA